MDREGSLTLHGQGVAQRRQSEVTTDNNDTEHNSADHPDYAKPGNRSVCPPPAFKNTRATVRLPATSLTSFVAVCAACTTSIWSIARSDGLETDGVPEVGTPRSAWSRRRSH